VGEKLNNLEEFHPERMATRILGMGDGVGLGEKAQEQFSAEEAEKMQEKMAKGSFSFDDFLKQMQSVKKMGGLKDIMKMLPGMSGKMAGMDIDDSEIKGIEAIVHSMTRQERRDPDIIDASRRRRIARGCGMETTDVSGLVKTFNQSKQMMKAISGMGMRDRMKTMSQMGNMDLAGMLGGKGRLKTKQRSKRKKPDRKKRSNKARR